MPYENYLCHEGIKGMKWGVRRYQNEDGSLTPAGKVRYGVGKALSPSVPQGKGKPNISPAKVGVREASNTVNSIQTITSNAERLQRSKRKEDFSSMSDDELRKRINRLQLETQYAALNDRNTQAGFERTQAVLGIVGGTLAIATSAITIGEAIQKARGR